MNSSRSGCASDKMIFSVCSWTLLCCGQSICDQTASFRFIGLPAILQHVELPLSIGVTTTIDLLWLAHWLGRTEVKKCLRLMESLRSVADAEVHTCTHVLKCRHKYSDILYIVEMALRIEKD